ncbi:rhomboid family intramembrane serine protease [Clostridium sp.]|uniref:rhomboid family intramembrane serine protease n=1 Tax=Clostridium sp. TaxID=1506 RepID=UPI002621B813|nr:rhomboid family intramembrane serine protease [Clostridium sp.]
MNKLENILFSELTKQAGFYIKDYYSEFLKENKWIAIMENEDFIYVAIVCKNNESDFVYYEAMSFLKKTYAKKISLNIVICTGDNYESLIHQHYNKLIYSEKEKQVVYSDDSCKPLVSILNYSIEKEKLNKPKVKYKENLVTYILICINILIFIITVFLSKNIYDIDSYTLIELGAKVNVLINNGQPWRLITCAFLHGGLSHIAFNMYALKIIGSEVECLYGKVKYIAIYLLSALGGSVFSYLFNANSISVGASGAIFGLLGAMIIFGIRHKNRIGKAYIVNLFKVLLINIFIGVTISNIDNGAHIGGLVFGVISALVMRDKKIY